MAQTQEYVFGVWIKETLGTQNRESKLNILDQTNHHTIDALTVIIYSDCFAWVLGNMGTAQALVGMESCKLSITNPTRTTICLQRINS